MIDAVAAFRTFLLSDAAISAAVASQPIPGDTSGTPVTWVFAAPPGMPEGVTTPPPPSIVLQQVGGTVSDSTPVIDPRFYVRCYGPDGKTTNALAGMIYDACYANGTLKCNRVVNAKWFLFFARIDTLGLPAVEPDSFWPVASLSIHTRWAAQPIA